MKPASPEQLQEVVRVVARQAQAIVDRKPDESLYGAVARLLDEARRLNSFLPERYGGMA